jgi:hypothetical protein
VEGCRPPYGHVRALGLAITAKHLGLRRDERLGELAEKRIRV